MSNKESFLMITNAFTGEKYWVKENGVKKVYKSLASASSVGTRWLNKGKITKFTAYTIDEYDRLFSRR